MQFKITRVGQFVFTIRSIRGQIIRPAHIHDIVRQLVQEFQINPNGIRFFWPDDDEVDIIMALLPDRDTQWRNNSAPELPPRLSMTKS